jgi:hypothetical protein
MARNVLSPSMTTSPNIPYSFRQGGRTLFQSTGSRVDVSTPQKRLALAVLSDAVRQVRQGGPNATDDEVWFASDAADHPFAFVAICHALGLDADHLRRGIRRLRRGTPHAHAA